jgi:hypothetical protein
LDRFVINRIISARICLPLKSAFRWAAAFLALPAGGLCFALALAAAASPAGAAAAQEKQVQSGPLKISILLSTRNDRCFDPGDAPAIRHLARLEQNRINAAGGIAGRKLVLEFLDDAADAKNTLAQVHQTIADKQAIAVIGLTNSNRAKEVFDAAGKEIRESGLPWLSNISVNGLFAGYENVFTMRGAQEDDSIPVMAQLVKDMKFRRPAFIGIKDQLFSSALSDGLKKELSPVTLISDVRLPLKDNKVDPADVAAMTEELKRTNPDFIFLPMGGPRIIEILSALEAAGIHPPAMVFGRLEAIFTGSQSYSNDLYQLAWDGLPDAYNDRVRKRLFRSHMKEFQFEGRQVKAAPGWKSGECKPRAAQNDQDVLSSANLRAVGVGLQYRDMVAMIAEILKAAEPTDTIENLRSRIVSGVRKSYASGHGVFQGDLENWSFRPASRAAARTPFIIMRPKDLGTEQLAPFQYVGLRNDTLRQIQTLYVDVDLTRAFRIDDREKSFVAEFYLSMHLQKDESLDQIEFANAFLDPQTNNKQITIRPLHQGGQSDAYPSNMKIYAVSGKFMFQPNFGNYPFDTQRFSIDLRAKNGDAPFIIQPSPTSLRDQAVDAEGWKVKEQYVGYDGDFLPIIDARSHERSVVPFYKGSFVWVMKREATDYFLTVVVPLAFIMIIAYLAIFIPRGHFEAIVTIQVTALLSAVALYLTIAKVDSDEATLSDKIFLFDYMLISLMIVISILRVNRVLAHIPRLDDILAIVHVVLIPVMVGLMALYVIGSSMSDGQTASAVLPAILRAIWG